MKAIVAGAVVLMVLFLAILLVISRKPPQDITVRHVKSAQSATNITTMIFAIENHTAIPYVFFPNEVQIRNGNAWTKFRDRHIDSFPHTAVGSTSLVYCTVSVTNLPAKSVVRFSIRLHKELLGLSGLFMRAVYGKDTEVTSDEFVETVK